MEFRRDNDHRARVDASVDAKDKEFKKDNGKKVKEDVGADVKENYVLYHLSDDDSEVWVINDFNRVGNSDGQVPIAIGI